MSASNISRTAWAYLLFTPVAAFLAYISTRVQALYLDSVAAEIIGISVSVVGTFAGAAFHIRHPDAWSRFRPIATALALGPVALVFTAIASVLVIGLMFRSSDRDGLSILSMVVTIASSGLGIVATGLFWLGFHRARRRANRKGQAAITVIIIVVAILTASSIVRIVQSAFGQPAPAATFQLALAATSLVGAAFATGLTITLVAGARAGEEPREAWAIAALGRAAALGARIVVPIVLIAAGPVVGPADSVVVYQLANAIVPVTFLVAVALGLPGTVDEAETGTLVANNSPGDASSVPIET